MRKDDMEDKTNLRVQDHRDPVIICKQEDNIKTLVVDVAEIKGDVKNLDVRINGSMDKIACHLTEGEGYRKLIIGTAVSLALSILGGVLTTWIVTSQLGYTMGKFANQIEVNTKLLDIDEEIHRETVIQKNTNQIATNSKRLDFIEHDTIK